MNKRTLHIILFTLAVILACSDVSAQFMSERRFVRRGNRDYEKQNYAESEIEYLRAKGKDSLSFAAGYNLGNAYYRQGRFEEAAAAFSKPAPRGATLESAAHSFYNAGNAQFQQRKLEEALESYKQSLRLNPNDTEAKFNLAYVKKLLEKDQQNQDQNKDQNQQDSKDNKQDQNKNNDQQNQNDKQDQNQGNEDKNQNNDKGQGDNNKDGQNGDQGQNDQQQEQPGMGKEAAEQMLQAIEMGDEKTREKVDAQKGRAVGGSSKNW